MSKPSTYTVVKSLVLIQAIGAAVISFMHIVEVGQRYGLGWQSWIAPFLIDGFAILGTIGRSAGFAEATRRVGFRLMLGAGAVSLACNVLAGTNAGQRVFGVLVVAGFVTAEWYATKLEKAPAAAKAGRRCEPGCSCGKHAPRKAAAKSTRARKPRAPKPAKVSVEAMLAADGPVPTSPAPYGA